jgi:hypothetical protein
VEVYAYLNPDGPNGGDYVSYASVDSGSWTMSLDPSLTGQTLYFFLQIGGQDFSFRHDLGRSQYISGSLPVINLGSLNLSRVFLSGTVGTISLNNGPTGGFSVAVLDEDGYELGYSYGRVANEPGNDNGGDWTVVLEVPSVTTVVHFMVSIYPRDGDGSVRHDTEVTRTISPVPAAIEDIELGDINLNTVTLSGSLSSLTLNNQPVVYEEADIIAFDRAAGMILGRGGIYDSSWSLTAPAPASPVTVSFAVTLPYGNGIYYLEQLGFGKNITLTPGGAAPVSLGAIAVNVKPITVSVNSGGVPVQVVVMPVRELITPQNVSYNENMLLKLYAVPMVMVSSSDENGPTLAASWTLPVPPALNSCQFIAATSQSSYYLTPSPVDISSGTVSLDLSQMTPLDF